MRDLDQIETNLIQYQQRSIPPDNVMSMRWLQGRGGPKWGIRFLLKPSMNNNFFYLCLSNFFPKNLKILVCSCTCESSNLLVKTTNVMSTSVKNHIVYHIIYI